MGAIDLTSDERKKAFHEEWNKNNQEYENLLKVNNKVPLRILYSTYLPEKVSKIEPTSDQELKRVTIFDSSAHDDNVLINLNWLNKKQPVTNEFFQAYQNHNSSAYLQGIENEKLGVTEVQSGNELGSSNVLSETKNFKTYSEVNLNYKKEKNALKSTRHEKTSDYPVKYELDLGFLPQLPLLSIDRIKNIHFEKDNKIQDFGASLKTVKKKLKQKNHT